MNYVAYQVYFFMTNGLLHLKQIENAVAEGYDIWSIVDCPSCGQ